METAGKMVPLRVMSKTEWLSLKNEFKSIKKQMLGLIQPLPQKTQETHFLLTKPTDQPLHPLEKNELMPNPNQNLLENKGLNPESNNKTQNSFEKNGSKTKYPIEKNDFNQSEKINIDPKKNNQSQHPFEQNINQTELNGPNANPNSLDQMENESYVKCHNSFLKDCLVKIVGLPGQCTKEDVKIGVGHFCKPEYVDLRGKSGECVVRFGSKTVCDAFVEKYGVEKLRIKKGRVNFIFFRVIFFGKNMIKLLYKGIIIMEKYI